MRVRTELSEKPPVFTVEKENQTAVITFFTDVQEEQREDGVAWLADMWVMNCTWAENLEARVSANPDLWLAKIKSVTTAEEQAERLKQMQQTAVDDAICELADMVAVLMEAVGDLANMIGQ